MIKKLLSKIIFPNTCSNDAFVKYLIKRGAKIGKGTRFINPKQCHIDINRAEYISIGEDCCIVTATILAHDYSWYILRDACGEMLPDPGGKVTIGNNCFIGHESCILKGTTIGDNVIIGSRSVVTGGNIPSNTVWAGVPARQICTLEEYYEKKKKEEFASIYYRKNILKQRKETIEIEDWGWFALYFLPRTIENYEKYVKCLEFNGIADEHRTKEYFFSSKPIYNSYEEFMSVSMEK